MSTGYWSLLKWACLALSIGSIVAAGILIWLNDEVIVADSTPAGDEGDKPQANVEKPQIVERKGERIIWRLQADSAQQQEEGMNLAMPRLELFTDQGEAVPIRGDAAWFEPAARNIIFQGHVQVLYREWTLKSEQLQYDSARDEVLVPGPFTVIKPGTSLKGEVLRAEHKSEKLIVEKNVRLEDSVFIRNVRQPGKSVAITSGSAMVDHRHNRAEFSGQVHLKRDDFDLYGDRLVVTYRSSPVSELDKAEAYGHVIMQQGEKQGKADSAVYNQEKNELVMSGSAEVSDPSGTVRGEKLIHHMDTSVTSVEKGASGEDGKRARMIIEEESANP